MQEKISLNKLFITINSTAEKIFAFTLNPKNTPLWIEDIVEEYINTETPNLGTIYKNKNRQGQWSEYELIDFQPPHTFTLKKLQDNYYVQYNIDQIDENTTEFVYTEWVTEGTLENPFDHQPLEKLKTILESNHK